jgi:hypothetical protein
MNHKAELNKKARGDIFLKKKSAADKMANTFTSTIMILISFRLIK